MALPMISETREAYPGSSVTLLTPDYLAELFENNPAVDSILKIPPQHVHGLLAVMKIRDILSSHEFDVGYVLPPSFGAAAGVKLAGVQERIGYIADGRRMLLTRPLPLPTPLNSEHRSQTYFNLLRRGAGVDLEFTHPNLPLNDGDREAAAEILTRFGVAPTDEYCVVAVRAVAESRRWGSDKYSALIKEIVSRWSLKAVLVGVEADRAEGDVMAATAGPGEVVNLAGRTGLREVAAVMSLARVFVGNDSGPAHLAAAVDVPSVVISGADDPKETSPVSPRKRLVYADHLDCISCVKNVCPVKGDGHMACMKAITMPKAIEAVESALAG